MGKNFKPLVFFLAALIVLGFFLPWVSAESKQAGAVTKLLTGKRQQGIANISGLQIPLMANSEESRLIISIVKIFNPGAEGIDKKSYLVLVIPFLAIIFALLIHYFEENKWVNLAIGIIGVLIFAITVIKIKTTDLEKLVLQIKIGLGMWIILWSYLVMGILGIIQFVGLSKSKS